MKIILSRKGFDASYGGKPSPIFPDGTLYSLPIPDDHRAQHSTCYEDVNLGEHNLGQVVQDLTNGKVLAKSLVHLDPGLNSASIRPVVKYRSKSLKALLQSNFRDFDKKGLEALPGKHFEVFGV